MRGYLLDTSHCIRLLNGDIAVIDKLRSLQNADIVVAINTIVGGELYYGAEKSERSKENLDNIHEFLRSMPVLPVDEITSAFYGRLKTEFITKYGPKRKRDRKTFRTNFMENDLWIAASARQHGLTVAGEDKHFRKLAAAKIVNLESWIMSQ